MRYVARLPEVLCLAMALCTLCVGLASAGWREDMGTFRIGVVAAHWLGRDAPARRAVEGAYADALDMPVDVYVAPDYPALIKAQASGYVQYAVYSAVAYVVARRSCSCVEPLVAPVDGDGAVGFRAALFLRKPFSGPDAGIENRRIAIGPADSVAGRLLPLAVFAPQGLPLSGNESFLVQADSESAARTMFIEGRVDGLFGWKAAGGNTANATGTPARLHDAGIDPSAYDVFWQSDTVRYGPHALKKDLDPELGLALLDFLRGLRESRPKVYAMLEEGHAGGFVPVTRAAYETVAGFVDDIAPKQAGR